MPRSGRRSPTDRSETAHDRLPAVDRHDRPVLRDPRHPRGHPRARSLRDGPPVRGARPGVRHRLPAPREDPALEGRDPLHAQLATDRRVRQARRRRWRGPRRSAFVLRPGFAQEARHPRRGRRHERRARVRHLHRHCVAGLAVHGPALLRGPTGITGRGRGVDLGRRAGGGRWRAIPVHHGPVHPRRPSRTRGRDHHPDGRRSRGCPPRRFGDPARSGNRRPAGHARHLPA